jgi:type I restriction enzyme M protein
LVVLRRLDCVLEPTKPQVLKRHDHIAGKVENIDPVLEAVSGEQFFNISPLDFRRLLDDPANVADNLRAYIAGFSAGARDVIEKFEFDTYIARLDKANLLYLVLSKFAEIDLHPETVSNLEMGYLYEELIRRFSELSNETAGEHFTPREVIRLMVNLLFVEDDDALTKPGIVRTLFDPAAGTGGMLSVAEAHLRELNPHARLEVFGQELNAETYAVARSDLMIKGQDASHFVLGNSFTEDGFVGQNFDYLLANPPFGVELEEGRGRHPQRTRDARLRRPLRCRTPTDQRRKPALPPAHDLQDEASRAGWLAGSDRFQRLAPVHGRGRIWRVRDPPLDHRERLA